MFDKNMPLNCSFFQRWAYYADDTIGTERNQRYRLSGSVQGKSWFNAMISFQDHRDLYDYSFAFIIIHLFVSIARLFERRYVRVVFEIFETFLFLCKIFLVRLSSFCGIFGYHKKIMKIRGWTDFEKSSSRYHRRSNCKDLFFAFGFFLFILFYECFARDQTSHIDHQISGDCIPPNFTSLDRYLARKSQLQYLSFYGHSHVSRVYVDVDVRSI